MHLDVDKGIPITDVGAAHAMLEPLPLGGDEITVAQRKEIVSWARATPLPGRWLGAAPRSFSTRLWQRTVVEHELLTNFINGAFASGTLPANLRELWAACRSLRWRSRMAGTVPSPRATWHAA